MVALNSEIPCLTREFQLTFLKVAIQADRDQKVSLNMLEKDR